MVRNGGMVVVGGVVEVVSASPGSSRGSEEWRWETASVMTMYSFGDDLRRGAITRQQATTSTPSKDPG